MPRTGLPGQRADQVILVTRFPFRLSTAALMLLRATQWFKLMPHSSLMYVQKLPTPTELWTVPQGVFARIDACVANASYVALHNAHYENKGYSPRCPIKQVTILFYSMWFHNCSGLDTNGTIKGVLQGWVEGRYKRWTDYTYSKRRYDNGCCHV